MQNVNPNRSPFSDQLLLWLAVGILLFIMGGAFISLFWAAENHNFLKAIQSSYIQRVLTFTIWQSVLSTVISLGLAIPLTRFFFYHRFHGRQLILTIFGLCLVMPVIIVILGIIQIHGNSGIVKSTLDSFGYEEKGYLYGLTGILIAHVFFNTPLAVRSLLSRLEAIPAEQWQISAQLGFTSYQRFKLIELPALRAALPGLAALILMLCFTSFAIILTLGGGPKATTLEVAIYQALHFDYNLGRAVALSGLQLAICATLTFIMVKFGKASENEISYREASGDIQRLFPREGFAMSALGWTAMLIASLLVFPPLLSILIKGISNFSPDYLFNSALLRATGTSLFIALSAALLSVMFGISLCQGIRHMRQTATRSMIETLGAIILVFSPFALATGLFLIFYQYVSVAKIGPFLVVLINALMSLPFVLRILVPAYDQRHQETHRLCQSLGITGWSRFQKIDFPLLRQPMSLALAYAATLSLGDFGVIALFGSESFSTLPLYIYRAMGAYRMDEAAFVALLLIGLSFCLFRLLESLAGGTFSFKGASK